MRMTLAPEQPSLKQVYNFAGGINTLAANEQLRDQVSPYLRNTRYKSRETVLTRKGPGYYSDPIDEAQDSSVVSVPNGNQPVSLTTKQAAKFFPSLTQCLTRVDLNLRTATGAGVIRVELWSDNAGSPGTLLAESSIQGASVSASYSYVPARFLSAPSLTAFTNYWIVAYVQSDGTGSFEWGSTTTGTTSKANIGGAGFTSQSYDLTLKTFIAPNNPILGGVRFYKSDGSKKTVIANKKGVYSVNDITGAVTQIFAGNTSATNYTFEAANDLLFWTNGFDAPQQWNGTTVSAIAGSPPIATSVKMHKNRLFFVSASDPTRIVFSEAGDFNTYLSVNFFYVPTPKSPDPVYKLVSLQDNLFIWTRNTKYVLYGADLSTFTLRRSTGLQGTSNPDSVVTYDNYAYSVSDNGIYQFNGATDAIVSDNPNSLSNVQPDFLASDRSKMTSVVSGNYLRVFYPSAGSSYNNMAFIYDLVFQIWFIDDQSYFAKAFSFKGSGDNETLVLGSSRVGQIFYADTQDSDLGCPITFDYRTQYETFDRPAANKQIKRFYPEFTGTQSNYSCSVYVDINMANAPALIADVPLIKNGPVWGSFTWGTSTWGAFGNIKPRLNVTGKFTSRQYRFIHRGVNNPIELIGFAEYFFIRNAR